MRLLSLLFTLMLAMAPLGLSAQREKLPPDDLVIVENQWPDAVKTGTGLRTKVLREGFGAMPVKGDVVEVLYVGRLLDGTIFDATRAGSPPFSFRVGRGEVISGWDEGLQLMKVGEKRLLIVPFELGYGARGSAPMIPRKATLVFEVELIGIKPRPDYMNKN